MSRSDDLYNAQRYVLQAYDALTYSGLHTDLQSLKSVRKCVLDLYWLLQEFRIAEDNPTDQPLEDTEAPF